ncbi:hypothetical protein JY651_28550 [Pyxidicoccus parkwayensis]|uniref:Uncharacterized protein n=1 Tax=Pyxidicoccus parkwayensis TaxID=2813578 RepID=A0ABX7NT17_9BACT|nr:hypothetical protein [Pyxidicoccus parkwaysis]QSQ19283.1 hypothetical protein JY651_28550 [Pyxidicoccus parkwaysis]
MGTSRIVVPLSNSPAYAALSATPVFRALWSWTVRPRPALSTHSPRTLTRVPVGACRRGSLGALVQAGCDERPP